MGGPVLAPVQLDGDQLHVLSREHRLYIGLSRDGSYLHVVAPSQVELTDVDGNVVRPAGALACTCKGSTYHGSCYRLRAAEAFERGEVDVDAWTDAAPGELVEAWGR